MSPDAFSIKVNLLSDVLAKKKAALTLILNITENQETLLTQPPSQEGAAFFRAMSLEKQKNIDDVLECDNVFSEVFGEISQSFEENANKNRADVLRLQEDIKSVMDLDIKIRFQEARNKELLEKKKNVQTPVENAEQKPRNIFEEYQRFTKL